MNVVSAEFLFDCRIQRINLRTCANFQIDIRPGRYSQHFPPFFQKPQPKHNSPRKSLSGIPHILHPLPHQLGQLLLVDPHHLLLRYVVVLVLLQPPVLRGVLGKGTEALAVRRLGVVVAAAVLDLSLHLHLGSFVEDVRYPLLDQLVVRTAECRDSGVFAWGKSVCKNQDALFVDAKLDRCYMRKLKV